MVALRKRKQNRSTTIRSRRQEVSQDWSETDQFALVEEQTVSNACGERDDSDPGKQEPLSTTLEGEDVTMIELPITPVPKPRMTRADRWKQRECVIRYWEFKDNIQSEFHDNNYTFPVPAHVIFLMPIPQSWSQKKQQKMLGQPHLQRPDKDNLEKAILDALFEEDSHVWDGRVSKFWSRTGKILIKEITPCCYIFD